MTRPYFPHPRGCQVVTLEPIRDGDFVLEAASGSTPDTTAEECWGGSIPWLTPKEVTEQDKYRYVDATVRAITTVGLSQAGKLWPPNTVLLTKRAPVGVPVINRVEMATNQGFLNFRCGSSLLPEFLYYWLLANGPYLDAVANGSTYPEIYVGDLFEIEVAIPPLSEQRAISEILGLIDDKIELNRRMNGTLEAIAQAIFKSWFVDFDPVRAKAEGWNSGLPKRVGDLFPDRLEISELGEIPVGWRATKWGDLVDLEYGKGLGDYAGNQRAYPVYGTNGKIGSHSEPLCVHPGIIIGRKGAYRGVHFCSAPFFVIDTAFYVEPKVSVQLRWAYYELLRLDINSMDSGSAIPSTSREDFYSMPVLSPPFEVQQAFVQILNPCWARQELNNNESGTLAALRDTLLPKLISDELRVKNVGELAAVAI